MSSGRHTSIDLELWVAIKGAPRFAIWRRPFSAQAKHPRVTQEHSPPVLVKYGQTSMMVIGGGSSTCHCRIFKRSVADARSDELA